MEEKEEIRYMFMPDKLEWEELTHFYGKVVIQPLERGFSATLGNSLRRLLLSSIPGAAITSVRIDGVQHEFSSVPGVVEDVPQVIANLKQVIIRLYDEKKGNKLFIDVKDAGEVRAGDIQTDGKAEIFNPTLHIATLNEGGHFKVELEVEEGKGYQPLDKVTIENAPVGTIHIDRLFSPIKKVNFRSENMQVGERTDYEKLILEIWTNGSIEPQKALEYASYLLIQHSQFILESLKRQEVKQKVTREEMEKGLPKDKKELFSKKVADFDLSIRCINILKRANIQTIGELTEKTEDDMLQYKNFGEKSLQELKDLLAKLGFSFKESKEK